MVPALLVRLTPFLLGVLLTACRREPPRPPSTDCASCHPAEVTALASSHHARGHALATSGSVPEGDVGGFRVHHDGGSVIVSWAGGSGRARYTLGVEPLVQLAVETAGGALQVPPIGWQPDAGWLRVPTLEGAAGDWRTPSFNWNGSCAPCHATGFRVGVTPSGTFESRWSSLSVSCEACHGAASGHLQWLASERPPRPGAGFAFSLRDRATFSFVGDGGIAQADALRADVETEVCAACHSRRRPLVDDGLVSASHLDRFEPALLARGLYRADGRIADEVYEVGSFSMSRMQRSGVRCAHCHEPHSGELRLAGNALCAQCHRPAVFDAPAHHGGAVGSACVDCHMPTVTVLGVDVRHDHSFRRPSSTPTSLESETSAAFESLFEERADAPWRWRALVSNPALSAFERASAFPLHQGEWTPGDLALLEQAARDDDDWLRSGAALALPSVPPASRARLGLPLLTDRRLAVRVQAGRALSGLVQLPERLRQELENAERVNGFRGEAWLNLSALATTPSDAARLLETGLQRDPTFIPLRINLADVRRAEGGATLEGAAAAPGPWQTAAAHALGLARWRAGNQEGARRAFELAASDGVGAHLVAWCLAERSVRGDAAGWRALDALLRRHPGKKALLDLALDWAARDGDKAHTVALRAEERRWLAPVEP